MAREWLIARRGRLTQAEMARMAGVSRSYYSQLETGRRGPSVAMAKRIAEAIDCPWSLFFEQNEVNKHQKEEED